MSWLKTFKRGDGGYDTFNWNLGDSAMVALLTVFFGFIFLLLAVAIIPFYLLLVYSFSIEGQRRTQSLVGIVACNIWLADYHFGGLNLAFWGNVFPETFASLTVLNVIMLIIFLCLLVFDEVIFETLRATSVPMVASWIIFIALLYFLYPLFDGVLGFIDVADVAIWMR